MDVKESVEMNEQIRISLDLLDELKNQVKGDLERSALQTIHQRNLEKGMTILQQIEGVERFMQAIHQASRSITYRMGGHIEDVAPNAPSVIRNHKTTDINFRKKKKTHSTSSPVVHESPTDISKVG